MMVSNILGRGMMTVFYNERVPLWSDFMGVESFPKTRTSQVDQTSMPSGHVRARCQLRNDWIIFKIKFHLEISLSDLL